jgi:hypothetical protein
MTTLESDVIVKLDDRVRLMSAVLAATRWAEAAQTRKPHGTHAHARATRKKLMALRGHGAVVGMQTLLDQGAPLEAMFTLALLLRWPELTIEPLPRWAPANWDGRLGDFFACTDLTAWWHEESAPWQKSLSDVRKVLQTVRLKPFFEPFFGEVKNNLVFIPNISYPTDQELGLHVGDTLVCIVPPRLAWGDSAPWPFDEDPTHVYRAAITQYGRILMLDSLRANRDKIAEVLQTPLPTGSQFRAIYPTWEDQLITIFIAAAVAIYLEDHVSSAESSAYVLMERKVRGMTVLPAVISVLRRYLSEHRAGRYQTFIDFLPVFPRQLRIAARIVAL